MKNSKETPVRQSRVQQNVMCNKCKKNILELIDILLDANTQSYDDLILQHEHYLFDKDTFEKINDLRNKLSA